MQINITTNFADAQRLLGTLAGDIRTQALTSAINKTVAQAKTQMVREIVSEYNVTAAFVRDRLRVKRAFFRAGGFEVSTELDGTDGKRRSSNVIRFMEKSVTLSQARKRAKDGTLNQLRFKVKKVGVAKIIRGAFIGNKGRTVFIRTSDKRLPIKAVRTIGIPSMFNQRRINAAVLAVINDKFQNILKHEVDYYTTRFNAS